jgi:inward rectifier potassium channel
MLSLSMTVVHITDAEGPLYGLDAAAIRAQNPEFLVTAIGTDSTCGQTIPEVLAYRTEDLVWDKKFADILTFDPDGRRIVDTAKLHLLED